MPNNTPRFLIILLFIVMGMVFLMQANATIAHADGSVFLAIDTPSPTTTETAVTATPQVSPVPTLADSPHAAENNCMMCHSNPDFYGTFENQESVSLYVNQTELNMSIHADAGLNCEACHTNISAYPHTEKQQLDCTTCHPESGGSIDTKFVSLVVELPYVDKRAMILDINDKCRTCHEEEYKSTDGSAHEKVFQSGNTAAPMCVDCHGGHNTIKPGTPRTVIVDICGKCHESVYTSYEVSVHGDTLIRDPANLDVPTCIECHGVHSVRGPRQVTFRGDSIVTCGGCHGNKQLMEKYDISTDVFNTYLGDYHGRTVNLFQEAGKTSSNKATCYDCHGIHNIRRPNDSLSSVYPANLQHTCQQCHTDASIRFPQAWLSHTEISWEKTPTLFLIKAAYVFLLIPGTIGAFIIYIALDARRRWLDKRSIVLKAIEEDSDEYEFEK